MRIILIVILIDLLIFSTSLIFIDDELRTLKEQEYHMDKYGYHWKIHK